jgi:hypothetical protein
MNKLLHRLPICVAFVIVFASANLATAQDRSAPSKVWTGSEDLARYGDLSFEVFGGGRVLMTDTDGVHEGTWRQSGGTVTLYFYEGKVVYSGSLRGNVLSGTARNDRTTWNWSVELQSAAPALEPPPLVPGGY